MALIGEEQPGDLGVLKCKLERRSPAAKAAVFYRLQSLCIRSKCWVGAFCKAII